MQDTLQNGDSLLVNKFIYRIHDPERYDIIVFYPKGHDVDEYYVKRIYGLPGETVYIDNNSIYINGKKIDDPYAKDAMDDSQIELGTKEKPYTLKSDEYYVLGCLLYTSYHVFCSCMLLYFVLWTHKYFLLHYMFSANFNRLWIQ